MKTTSMAGLFVASPRFASLHCGLFTAIPHAKKECRNKRA